MQIGGFNNLNNNSNHIQQNKKSSDSSNVKLSSAISIDEDEDSLEALSNSLNSQISALVQGVNNANDGIALLQKASKVVDTLSKDTTLLSQDDLDKSNQIIKQMKLHISNANFNGEKIFGKHFTLLTGLENIEISIPQIPIDKLDIENKSSILEFKESIKSISLNINSISNNLATSISSTLETVKDLSNSKEELDDTTGKTRLSAAHSNDHLNKSISTLLK